MNDEIPAESKPASVFIEGFSISGYRSFGEKPQRIGPLKKINLLIGQNNCGKSNILRFLAEHYSAAVEIARRSQSGFSFEGLDCHQEDGSGHVVLEFGLTCGGRTDARLREKLLDNRRTQSPSGPNDARWTKAMGILDRLFRSRALCADSPVAWFRYESSSDRPSQLSPDLIESIQHEGMIHPAEWVSLWDVLTDRQFMWLPVERVSRTLSVISPVILEPPDIFLISALRRVDEASPGADDWSGQGIIDKLLRLQNPSHDKRDDKKLFAQINVLLQDVTSNTTATLEIPHDRKQIIVNMDGRTLPLSHLGTGIHELIILAVAATVLKQSVLCIEEPELHLHPTQQRRLARYLQEKTDNQYFIATHSAHFLDTPGAAVFHVRHNGKHSEVESVITDSGKRRICDDLGYHASDLLQANCLIWVEGPSDRIYLNHWIRHIAPELIEGLHYSIMFYGGRLLSHLSMDEQEVKDFISLRRLNQRAAILIDSDRKHSKMELNDTKRRVQKEFDTGPGFAWITKGREIENYVYRDDLCRAVDEIEPEAVSQLKFGTYTNCLLYRNKKGKSSTLDKVKVAKRVAGMPANLRQLDLNDQIERLVAFIKKSNEENKPVVVRKPDVS